MKSKERVKRRIAAIKAMTDPKKAIEELADLTYEIGEDACQEREEIRSLTEKNRIILMGNGNQEDSILYILGQTVIAQKSMMEKLDSIEDRLIGDLEKPDQSSVISRLCNVERVIANITKLSWMIIGVFVTQLALFAWAFFVH